MLFLILTQPHSWKRFIFPPRVKTRASLPDLGRQLVVPDDQGLGIDTLEDGQQLEQPLPLLGRPGVGGTAVLVQSKW